VWWCRPVIPATAESINRRIIVQAHPGKKRDPISKVTTAKQAGSMTQALKYMSSKCKALSSNPSTASPKIIIKIKMFSFK
jgi:hypothetical protein